MNQLSLITFTDEEFRIVAKELGERLAPFFLAPNGLKVMRIDLIGESGIGKSKFQQEMAQAMLYGMPVTRPANHHAEAAYAVENSTATGTTRQAIFVDSYGLSFNLAKRDIPERTAPGPLFVQHPDYDEKLDATNAAKIDVSPLVTIEFKKYADQSTGINITVHIPKFPMDRLKGQLIKKNIIDPPRGKLRYDGLNR